MLFIILIMARALGCGSIFLPLGFELRVMQGPDVAILFLEGFLCIIIWAPKYLIVIFPGP